MPPLRTGRVLLEFTGSIKELSEGSISIEVVELLKEAKRAG
jgi:hypothetical protein